MTEIAVAVAALERTLARGSIDDPDAHFAQIRRLLDEYHAIREVADVAIAVCGELEERSA